MSARGGMADKFVAQMISCRDRHGEDGVRGVRVDSVVDKVRVGPAPGVGCIVRGLDQISNGVRYTISEAARCAGKRGVE